MAAENGRENPALSERLLREPYRFDFFQAVRLLERLGRERVPGAPVGQDRAPDQEVVRFRAHVSQSFPASSISQIKAPPPRPATAVPPPLEMNVSFLGLIGAQGVLPQHYTTLLLRRLREKDFALRDFLDLFHHRLVSLFYRAWQKYRLPFSYERAREEAGEAEDLCTQSLYCLVGLGTGGLRGRLRVTDETFLYYGGFFAHFPRCALSLERMLADYFEVPLRVEQAQGQWLVLGEEDRSFLPRPDRSQGCNCELGQSLIAGERVWDVQHKFRLRVGPLSYEQFCRYLPGGAGLRALGQLTRAYVGPDLDFDVLLLLHGAEAPWCRLGSDDAGGARLGWNTWVRNEAFVKDVSDAVFFVDEEEIAG